MKIFLLTFNNCGRRQYDSFVVVAKSRYQAIKEVKDMFPDDTREVDWSGGFSTMEIKTEKYQESAIVLDSYRG